MKSAEHLGPLYEKSENLKIFRVFHENTRIFRVYYETFKIFMNCKFVENSGSFL